MRIRNSSSLSSAALLTLLSLLPATTIADPVAANAAANANDGTNLILPGPNSSGALQQGGDGKTPDGINCHGSELGCVGSSSQNILHLLRDYMSPLTRFPQRKYQAGQKIACKEHKVFPFAVGGYFCAYTQGNNVAKEGLGGQALIDKMEELISHGCTGCGSVPLSEDNNPDTMGMLTVNYVSKSECVGLCFYGANGHITEWRYTDEDDARITGGLVGVQNATVSKTNGLESASWRYIDPATRTFATSTTPASGWGSFDQKKKLSEGLPAQTSSP